MIDHDFAVGRQHLKALGILLLQAQTDPFSPSMSEARLYELMRGAGFGGERDPWLGELIEHGLVKSEEDFSRPGIEWDDRPQHVCLTPAGIYYAVSRAPLFAENWKGLTEDLPDEVVDAPWPIQAYYSPLPDDLAPTADSVVRFDHNEQSYNQALKAIEAVSEAVRSDNEFASAQSEVRDQKLEELTKIRLILEKREGWSTKLLAASWTVLGYLMGRFADQPIGVLAKEAWNAVQAVLGLR